MLPLLSITTKALPLVLVVPLLHVEERRLLWLRFYVSSSEFERAAELVVGPLEEAMLLRARAAAAAWPCTCCVADPRRGRSRALCARVLVRSLTLTSSPQTQGRSGGAEV